MSDKEKKRVVLLVDNKRRDLPGAALLAHHLSSKGVETFLEPLEAWRAVLAAHKPHMIVFNHLLGSHLVRYSKELHRRGVLVAVLPNEGILYSQEVLDFNASKFHNDAHIDYFFVWNEAHKQAIEKGNSGNIRHVEVVGVPRFDFYFEPLRPPKTSPLPTLLVCTNFVFAQYLEKPKEVADRLFAPWKDRISTYRNYWEMIETNHRSREKFFHFLDALAKEKRYQIILKPHPGEDPAPYEKWYDRLSFAEKERIRFDKESFIWELIPQCDVEIACETCTTTLESWICGKSTIELLLEKHPVFYHEFLSKMTLTCEEPRSIVDVVEQALAGEKEARFRSDRERHLQTWCDAPDGHATLKLASIIARAVENAEPDFSGIDWNHRRKALKLRLMHLIDQPYHFNPLSMIRFAPLPEIDRHKLHIYHKSIRPGDIDEWREKIDTLYLRGNDR
ncbi:surface carbohydrate biosynthesis protein [Nitratifractor sp.]